MLCVVGGISRRCRRDRTPQQTVRPVNQTAAVAYRPAGRHRPALRRLRRPITRRSAVSPASPEPPPRPAPSDTHLALLGVDGPDAHRLVVGARGHHLAVRVHAHHPHPLAVTEEGAHTVPAAGRRWSGTDGRGSCGAARRTKLTQVQWNVTRVIQIVFWSSENANSKYIFSRQIKRQCTHSR